MTTRKTYGSTDIGTVSNCANVNMIVVGVCIMLLGEDKVISGWHSTSVGTIAGSQSMISAKTGTSTGILSHLWLDPGPMMLTFAQYSHSHGLGKARACAHPDPAR